MGKGRAIGYTATGANTTSLAYRGSSAGGGYATARDLLRLDVALRRGEIADTAVLRSVTTRAPGNREVLANGGGEGANVEFSRVGDYTIIVLANMSPPAATSVLRQIVALPGIAG